MFAEALSLNFLFIENCLFKMALHPAHVPGLLLAGDGQLLRQPLHLLLDEQEVYYDSSTTG